MGPCVYNSNPIDATKQVKTTPGNQFAFLCKKIVLLYRSTNRKIYLQTGAVRYIYICLIYVTLWPQSNAPTPPPPVSQKTPRLTHSVPLCRIKIWPKLADVLSARRYNHAALLASTPICAHIWLVWVLLPWHYIQVVTDLAASHIMRLVSKVGQGLALVCLFRVPATMWAL